MTTIYIANFATAEPVDAEIKVPSALRGGIGALAAPQFYEVGLDRNQVFIDTFCNVVSAVFEEMEIEVDVTTVYTQGPYYDDDGNAERLHYFKGDEAEGAMRARTVKVASDDGADGYEDWLVFVYDTSKGSMREVAEPDAQITLQWRTTDD